MRKAVLKHVCIGKVCEAAIKQTHNPQEQELLRKKLTIAASPGQLNLQFVFTFA
jgi:hypothetical protein